MPVKIKPLLSFAFRKACAIVQGIVIGALFVVVPFVLMCMCINEAKGAEKTIKLNPYNTVMLMGYVDEDSVAKLIDEIVRNENDIIYMAIDSPGGSVEDGLKLIDAMQSSGKKFICVTTSAASMAFSILQSCTERYVTKHAVLMQHIGSYGISGDANKNKSYSDFSAKHFEVLNKHDRERIGLSKEKFYSLIQDDWWLIGEEAVSGNVADGIVSLSCSKDLSEKRIIDKYSLKHSDITIIRSGCPLVPAPVSISIEVKNGSTSSQAHDEIKAKKIDRKMYPNRYFGLHARDSPDM